VNIFCEEKQKVGLFVY